MLKLSANLNDCLEDKSGTISAVILPFFSLLGSICLTASEGTTFGVGGSRLATHTSNKDSHYFLFILFCSFSGFDLQQSAKLDRFTIPIFGNFFGSCHG